MKERTYLFEYDHRGSVWNLEIIADSEIDAKARVAKLNEARFVGTLEAKIPAFPGAGWLVRAWCWAKSKGKQGEEA